MFLSFRFRKRVDTALGRPLRATGPLVVLFLLLDGGPSVFAEDRSEISWLPNATFQQEIFGGGRHITTLRFKARSDLARVRVSLSRELRRFVSVEPRYFPIVRAGEAYALTLTARAPAGAPLQVKKGLLRLSVQGRDSERGLSAGLPLTVRITSPQRAIDVVEQFLLDTYGTNNPPLPNTGDAFFALDAPPDITEAFRAGTDGALVLASHSPLFPLLFDSDFTPTNSLKTAVSGLVSKAEERGMAVGDLRDALTNTDFHRNVNDTSGVDLLLRWDAEAAALNPPVRYRTTIFFSVDIIYVGRPHILLSGDDVDQLLAGNYTEPAGVLLGSSIRALHELTHVMVHQTGCFVGDDEALVTAIQLVYQSVFFDPTGQHLQSDVNNAVANGGATCLDRLGILPRHYVGGGSGQTSLGTLADLDIFFDVQLKRVTNSRFNLTAQQPMGGICQTLGSGFGNPGIVANGFSGGFTTPQFHVGVEGTVLSAATASGTLEFGPGTDPASPNHWPEAICGHGTISWSVPRSTAPPVLTVDDGFDGNSLNASLWRLQGPPPGGSSGVLRVANSQLEWTSVPGFNGTGVISTRRVAGDFDMQLDYRLLNWPTANGSSVSLRVTNLGPDQVSRQSSRANGESYVLFASAFAQLRSTDASGKLRLVRTGTTLSGYFYNGARWVLIGSAPTSSIPTFISIEFGSADPAAVGGIRAAVDNFKLNAGTIQ